MAENAVNHVIGALKIVVGWLMIAVKVQEAIIAGIQTALEEMKLDNPKAK